MAGRLRIFLLNGPILTCQKHVSWNPMASFNVNEIHLRNVHVREPFRRHLYLTHIATGTVCGFGASGYIYALQTAVTRLSQSN